MLKYKEILEKDICRSCLNKKYHLSLKPQNVKVYFYPGQCSCCGRVGRIVADVNFPHDLFLEIKLHTKKGKVLAEKEEQNSN